jgi:type IV conjugative transfer system coupling protein TraD
MLKTFTRGGQVTMHNFRMIRQVLSVTLLLTILCGIAGIGLKTWFSYAPYERQATMSYCWASFKLNIPFVKPEHRMNMTQNYTFKNGSERIVGSLDIATDPWHQLLSKRVYANFMESVQKSLWYMGGLFVLFCGLWVWRGKSKVQKEVLSGTIEVTPQVLTNLIQSKGKASDLMLAGIPLINNSETQHMLILGTTGTGKTNCLHELLKQVRARQQRAIIVDMTGVFIEKYYRSEIDKILNPLDMRTEPWSVWGECQNSSHLKSIASIMIPPNDRGEETYWVKASRTLFVATAEKLKMEGALTNKSFFIYAADRPVREIQSFYKESRAAAIVNADAKETVMGVRSHLRASLDALELFGETDTPFSIRDWISKEEEKGWLFLSSPPECREEMASLMSLWTSIAVEALNSLPRNLDRRLWIIIDELPAIKRMPKLHTMLAEVRQRGGCVILGTQDMSLLDDIYGHNIVKSISNLCSTKVVFRIEGADIA